MSERTLRARSKKFTLSLNSTKPQIPQTHISPTENFAFGEALVPPILDMIFDYLPAEDLKTCSEICPQWNASALYILAKRRAPGWFTCYKNEEQIKKVAYSPNLHYSNADVGIVFYNSSLIKLTDWVCLNKNSEEIAVEVADYFATELIPKSVDFCLLSVYRAASYYGKEKIPIIDVGCGSIFDGVLIPKIPSVRIKMFEFISRKYPQNEAVINSIAQPHEETKCLLIFSKNALNMQWDLFLNRLVENSVAIGGGIIKSLKTIKCQQGENRPNEQTVCIAFLKDKTSELNNFNAYSCCIKDATLTSLSDGFIAKLKHFRRNIELKQHSLAFRIACVSKSTALMEFQVFEEVFPNVLLASIHARGEFGWDCYPNANVPEKDEKQKYPPVKHQFSSIFVVITWD